MNMKWYHFRQNNSGGSFLGPKNVLVQAPSASTANALAQDYGVYFDGCEAGLDCECCGDRWDRVYSDSDCTDSPCVYGQPVGPSDNVMLVYLDGRVEGGFKSCD